MDVLAICTPDANPGLVVMTVGGAILYFGTLGVVIRGMPAGERIQPVMVWLGGLVVGILGLVVFGVIREGAFTDGGSIVDGVVLALAGGALVGLLAAGLRGWSHVGKPATAGGLGGIGFVAGAIGLFLLAIGTGSTCIG